MALQSLLRPLGFLSSSYQSRKLQPFTSPSLSSNSSSGHRARMSTSYKSPRLVAATATATDLAADIGDSFGDVQIFTAAGMPVVFKDLWDQNEGIAVVALLRHFGCFCSWELASELKEAKPKFDAAGVKLIAVGVGTPDNARVLAERLPFPLDTLYADPERKAYDILGLYFGIRRTFFNSANRNMWSRFQSTKKETNYTITATPDDKSGVLQQGGMLVFKGKQLVYAWKDEGTGDHAPLDDVFNVCSKASAAYIIGN